MKDRHPPHGTRAPTRVVLIHRHAALVRVTHWVNALCFCALLASGLQIFNAWPNLYWGQTGADTDSAVLAIGASEGKGKPAGYLRVAGTSIATTGVLGVSRSDGELVQRAFPAWLTLPSYQDLAAGRRWHFLFAWSFVLNGAAYLVYGFASGHFRRDLLPRHGEMAAAHLWHEVIDHARLRFPDDARARHYNTLQKLSYLGVIWLLLPLMLVTGLTMSPGMNAAFPWLLDLLGGRQSARTLHLACATVLSLFVAVHLAMVVLSGLWNNLRSMISGRYAIVEKDSHGRHVS